MFHFAHGNVLVFSAYDLWAGKTTLLQTGRGVLPARRGRHRVRLVATWPAIIDIVEQPHESSSEFEHILVRESLPYDDRLRRAYLG